MILGLDLSLSGSGISIINNESKFILNTSITSERINDSIKGRYERYNIILNKLKNILDTYNNFSIICIEQISYASNGRIVQLSEKLFQLVLMDL